MNNKKIICRDKDGKEFKASADQMRFRPGVYGVIVKDGKILLARLWDSYDFPGGGVNIGEKITDALVREVKEETGFDVLPKELLACGDDFHRGAFDGNFVQSIQVYYSCEIIGGELSKDHFDKKQFEDKYMNMAEWVDLKDAAKIKFYDPLSDMKSQLLEKISNGNKNNIF
jgi:ADP-ribose pyrophosphatase YjhB (NUDIX family)